MKTKIKQREQKTSKVKKQILQKIEKTGDKNWNKTKPCVYVLVNENDNKKKKIN